MITAFQSATLKLANDLKHVSDYLEECRLPSMKLLSREDHLELVRIKGKIDQIFGKIVSNNSSEGGV